MSLYTLLLKHYMAEALYPASVACLEADISMAQRGLIIKVKFIIKNYIKIS